MILMMRQISGADAKQERRKENVNMFTDKRGRGDPYNHLLIASGQQIQFVFQI